MSCKKVLALGFFDGIHIGHAALLNMAKKRAAEVSAEAAVLTFDNHPDNYVKGEKVKLINSAADRRYIARRFFGINDMYFIHFNYTTMQMSWTEFLEDVIAAYNVCHFVVGHDFRFGHKGEGTALKLKEYCTARNIGCDIIEAVKKDGIIVSSTYIRGLLLEGNVEKAKEFLGHPHLLNDCVRSGHRLGRTMEVPTVNMEFACGVLVPKHGVYAVKALIDEKEYIAVTNVGVRPTFNGDKVTVETNILGLNLDLYGKNICIEFYAFIRPEQKYDDSQALKRQIMCDIQSARDYFA